MNSAHRLILLLAAVIGLACAPVIESRAMPESASDDISSFAWRFYHQLGEGSDNLVFSPFSIVSVFAMVSAGAEGETLREMRTALSMSVDANAWHAGHGMLLEQLSALNREGDEYSNALTLRTVNDLWLHEGFEVGAAFLRRLEEHYDSAPRALDFVTDPDAARSQINAKVAADTANLIPALLPPGSVSADARLVLTNALYFKGGWASPFSHRATEEADFHAIDGSTASLPMMQRTGQFAYGHNADREVLRLPYDGHGIEMLVVMPTHGRFSEIADSLGPSDIEDMLQTLSSRRIELHFPRFSLRTSLPLVEALRSVGMQRVFTDAAELGGIAANLSVSTALHEAVIEVDEDGTEAAAATAAVISLTSMPMEEPEPFEVRVDRPFVFVIRVRDSGVPLFIGRFLKPQ